MGKQIAILKMRAGSAGGLEKYSERIADAFRQKGDAVTILSANKRRFPTFIELELFDRKVNKWREENQPDIVFGMDRNRWQTHLRAGNGVHAAYLKSRLHTDNRLNYWLHSLNPLHRKILQLEKSGFENPELKQIFANSQMVRGEILEHYKVDPAKIQVIYNGVEWHEMAPDFSDWEHQKQVNLRSLELNPFVFHLLFVGNGFKRKGLDFLLLALSKLQRKDFHLSIVGKDKKMASYQKKVIEFDLEKQVRFFGRQESMRPFYQIADCLVIPSLYDPFANVTVEALAMGVCVLSSTTNGGHEILTPENGVIIENVLDSHSMIDALTRALQKPKTRLSAACIRESVAYLDFPKQLRTLIESCE